MTMHATRRALMSAALTAPLWANWAARAAAQERDADAIIYNGRLITMDDSRPRATAMAIKAGRIMAVGDDSVRGLAGKATRLIDLKGA